MGPVGRRAALPLALLAAALVAALAGCRFDRAGPPVRTETPTPTATLAEQWLQRLAGDPVPARVPEGGQVLYLQTFDGVGAGGEPGTGDAGAWRVEEDGERGGVYRGEAPAGQVSLRRVAQGEGGPLELPQRYYVEALVRPEAAPPAGATPSLHGFHAGPGRFLVVALAGGEEGGLAVRRAWGGPTAALAECPVEGGVAPGRWYRLGMEVDLWTGQVTAYLNGEARTEGLSELPLVRSGPGGVALGVVGGAAAFDDLVVWALP